MTIIDFIPIGRANAITADELAARTGTSKRDVRNRYFTPGATVSRYAHQAKAATLVATICRQNAEEAQVYYRQQTSRVNSGMRALSAIERFIEERDTENE